MSKHAIEPLASQRVTLAAPVSFTGATRRLWRSLHSRAVAAPGWPGKTGWWTLLVLSLLLAWAGVAALYVFLAGFGFLLVPLVIWRLILRGRRKRKVTELRHAELLAAVRKEGQS
jgi:hypothetical protein